MHASPIDEGPVGVDRGLRWSRTWLMEKRHDWTTTSGEKRMWICMTINAGYIKESDKMSYVMFCRTEVLERTGTMFLTIHTMLILRAQVHSHAIVQIWMRYINWDNRIFWWSSIAAIHYKDAWLSKKHTFNGIFTASQKKIESEVALKNKMWNWIYWCNTNTILNCTKWNYMACIVNSAIHPQNTRFLVDSLIHHKVNTQQWIVNLPNFALKRPIMST